MKECKKETTVLGELIYTQKGYAFKSKWYTEEGYPIIKVSDFTDDSIRSDNLVHIPKNIASEYLKYEVKAKNVIIQTVGSWPNNPNSVVGKTVRVPFNLSGALLNQNSVKVIPKNSLDNGFLFYLLRSNFFKEYIINTAQGAANQASITLDSIKRFTFWLPDLFIQRKLSTILSNYDDLIENNTRRIEILEQMAKLVYEEWFVKFRFPGHENVKMISSELGEIPEGWEIKKIKDIAEITKGMSYKSENLVEEGGCAFVNLKCINRGGGFRYEGLKRFEGKFKERNVVNQNDIVIAVTDMTQNREIIARPARIPKMNEETILISMDLVKITPKNNDLKTWLYGLLKYSQFGETLKDFANGVNVLHLTTENMLEYLFTLPDNRLITKYTETVCNFYNIIDNLELKNQNLRKTRDLLLPKLISGEIDVSDLDIRIRNEYQEHNINFGEPQDEEGLRYKMG